MNVAVYFEAEEVMNRSYVDVSAHEIVMLLFLSGFVAFLLSTPLRTIRLASLVCVCVCLHSDTHFTVCAQI